MNLYYKYGDPNTNSWLPEPYVDLNGVNRYNNTSNNLTNHRIRPTPSEL